MSTMIVSYGGGTNSVAVLVGLHLRGLRPDAIVFADTGGERPETYEHIKMMQSWCARVGFPGITRVQYVGGDGEVRTLEGDCLKYGTLPSIAYGFKKCSQKFKADPFEKWVKAWPLAVDAWARGERVTKVIGFDADEPHRADRGREREEAKGDGRFTPWYPLIEWDMGRDECVEAIAAAGLPLPGKSSCFFCPSSKVHEILSLPDDMKKRAIAMEDAARDNLGSVKGLGRRFAWKPLIINNNAQGDMFDGFAPPIVCDCYDGNSD